MTRAETPGEVATWNVHAPAAASSSALVGVQMAEATADIEAVLTCHEASSPLLDDDGQKSGVTVPVNPAAG